MTAHSSDTREFSEADDSGAERSRPRRAASTVASFNENGTLSLLAGGVLVVLGVRSVARADRRGRGVVQALAGAALVAFGLRKRRSDSEGDAESGQDVSSEAAAHREQSTVHHQDETNPRGTSGEPDVEEQADAGNVEFSDEQDLESGRKPGMADEADAVDPRGSADDAEVDLSEASMADEASEAAGPSSTQSQPAQTDSIEPERDPGEGEEDEETDAGDADTETDTDDGTGTDEEPDPSADPGEATAEAEAAEPAGAAEEAIEGEIDDPDREGVETEGGAVVHTDTNESDNMDIDVDDVTDPDDEMNTEDADSEDDSGSHLDDDPPDEDDER